MADPFGLTDDGYTAPRTADFLDIIRDAYEAALIDLGLPADIDFDRDVFLGNITANMAARLGSLGEASQALFDAFNVNGATGIQLDNLAQIVGVTRQEATPSRVTLTYTGTVGTAVLVGDLAEGGGANDDQRWVVLEDKVIGGGGTVDVLADAIEAGAVVATTGQVDKIVTLRSGLTSVTNAADADTGEARETDSELRQRRQESLQISGGRNRNSLRAALQALAFVDAAAVIDNDTADQVTKQGIILEPHSVAVIIHPAGLTDAEKITIALLIYDQVATGIFTNGTDVVANVEGADGTVKVIRWDNATTKTVNVATTVVLTAGFALGDVDTSIQALIVAYFDALAVGEAVRILDLLALIATVDGVDGATVKLNLGSVDIVTTIAEIAVLGTNTVGL